MRILYLHGLDGVPRADKKEILENGGKVIWPKIDYRNYINDISLFEMLSETIKKESIDIIVGSSFGGYIGFYLSEAHNIPGVFFNPALHSRSIDVPVNKSYSDSYKVFILGKHDTTIAPGKTREWLTERFYSNIEIVEEDFGHSVPLDIFSLCLKYIK